MKTKLLLILLFTAVTVACAQDITSGYQKLARDIFKELVEINTTSGYGSTKAAEAMAAGKPVVGSAVDGLCVII